MALLINIVVFWFLTGLVLIAAMWLVRTVIKTVWPNWWAEYIVGEESPSVVISRTESISEKRWMPIRQAAQIE